MQLPSFQISDAIFGSLTHPHTLCFRFTRRWPVLPLQSQCHDRNRPSPGLLRAFFFSSLLGPTLSLPVAPAPSPSNPPARRPAVSLLPFSHAFLQLGCPIGGAPHPIHRPSVGCEHLFYS